MFLLLLVIENRILVPLCLKAGGSSVHKVGTDEPKDYQTGQDEK